MKNYRYSLEPYSGRDSRHDCPACNKKRTFALYIDNSTNTPIHENVGKCNREDKCGYHLTPKEYFENNGIIPEETGWTPQPKKEPEPIIFINPELMRKSLTGYDNNNLVKFLVSKFGSKITIELISKYLIGTSKIWQGANIFYQVDAVGLIHRGKIMLYNPETGRRTKGKNHTVHAVLKQSTNNPPECFFGEHLMYGNNKPVCVVESEKTALIASVYYPDFIWLACGGLGMLSYNKCKALKGKSVTLYPDLNSFDKWKEKADLFLPKIAEHYTVNNLLEKVASEEEKENGLDLADYLLRYDLVEFRLKPPPQTSNNTADDIMLTTSKECFKSYLFALLDELIEKIPQDVALTFLNEPIKCFRSIISIVKEGLIHYPNAEYWKDAVKEIYRIMHHSGHEQFSTKF